MKKVLARGRVLGNSNSEFARMLEERSKRLLLSLGNKQNSLKRLY